jgi:hypothetical protein
MKQFIALIIGLILVVSAAPLALAENETAASAKAPYCRAIGTKSEGWYGDSGLVRYARCAKCAAECRAIGTKSEGWYDSCDNSVIIYAKCLMGRYQLAVQNYLLIKEKYQNAVQSYEASRQRFMELKGNKSFMNINETPELMNRTKDFLYNSIDRGIKNIETVEVWINKTNLGEDTKATLTRNLDGHIANLEDIRNDIIDITIRYEAVETAREIRSEWRDARIDIKKAVGQVLGQRTNFVINKLEELSKKLELKIPDIKENGQDVEKLQVLLDEFNRNLDLAKEKSDAANEKFNAIYDLNTAENYFKDGRALLGESHQYLKEAQKTLAELVREFRAQNAAIGKEINATSSGMGDEG